MRIGSPISPAALPFGTAAFCFLSACAPAIPVLLVSVPPHAATFSLSDSVEVVRRVQQVFSCTSPANSLPYGTLGWRRDSTFVDVTLMQDLVPVGPAGEPSPLCWKGFRVDANGQIFLLPVQRWPYTAFRKSPPRGTWT